MGIFSTRRKLAQVLNLIDVVMQGNTSNNKALITHAGLDLVITLPFEMLRPDMAEYQATGWDDKQLSQNKTSSPAFFNRSSCIKVQKNLSNF